MTGLKQLVLHFSRPWRTWLFYGQKVPNSVHRANNYSIAIIVTVCAVYIANGGRFHHGIVFDPIIISQLVLLFLLPPVLCPLYWMTEWITIPFLLRPYHNAVEFLSRYEPNSSLIHMLMSISIYNNIHDRDEAGVRCAFFLYLAWVILGYIDELLSLIERNRALHFGSAIFS